MHFLKTKNGYNSDSQKKLQNRSEEELDTNGFRAKCSRGSPSGKLEIPIQTLPYINLQERGRGRSKGSAVKNLVKRMISCWFV